MNVEVTTYVDNQKSPEKEIVQKLREIILRTLPSIEEKLWMGVPWYGKKFHFVAFKDHVNLGFSVKGLSEEEKMLFKGKGQMMRHIRFCSLEDVDEARVAKLLRLVAEKSACLLSVLTFLLVGWLVG